MLSNLAKFSKNVNVKKICDLHRLDITTSRLSIFFLSKLEDEACFLEIQNKFWNIHAILMFSLFFCENWDNAALPDKVTNLSENQL